MCQQPIKRGTPAVARAAISSAQSAGGAARAFTCARAKVIWPAISGPTIDCNKVGPLPTPLLERSIKGFERPAGIEPWFR